MQSNEEHSGADLSESSPDGRALFFYFLQDKGSPVLSTGSATAYV